MAEKPTPLYSSVDEVVPPRGSVLDRTGQFVRSWWTWLWNFRRTVNDNFETAGVEDFSANYGGRLTALEEEIRELRLRDQAREIEASFGDVSPARETIQTSEVAPAFEIIQPVDVAPATEPVAPQDVTPAAAERAPEQTVTVSEVEELRQRVGALEGMTGTPSVASSLAEALEVIREQATADVLSLAPAVETGQLFKPRQWVQFIDPGQMYLPVTQPASGPNVYETVVNGSAWRCFEFAPGTLAADNDNVLFMVTPPPGWDLSPVVGRVIWSHPATVTNFFVAWRFQAGQYIDGSSGTAALSAEGGAALQDIGGITDAIYLSVGTFVTPVNLTPANTGFAWSPLLFRVGRRNQSEGVVGLSVNARLLGVALVWNLRPTAAS